MKADIKEQWVLALRSGEYKQGKSFLRVEDKKGELRHCCLGVLCDVLGRKWYNFPSHAKGWENSVNTVYALKDNGEMNSTDLPNAVLNKTGITVNQMNDLVIMNDGGFDYTKSKNVKAKKFTKIADWIEKNL